MCSRIDYEEIFLSELIDLDYTLVLYLCEHSLPRLQFAIYLCEDSL